MKRTISVLLFLFGLAILAFSAPKAVAQDFTLIGPYPDAPECAVHPEGWHGVWNYELGCYYDHQHGDDPRSVDHIFGTDFLYETGGEVRMFYQPAPVNDTDYRRKHYGLFWLVREGETCYSQFGNGCITDFRAQVHMLSEPPDNYRLSPEGVVSGGTYHVARIEARVCDEANPTRCGIIRLAGRQYLGDVIVDESVLYDFPEPRDLFGRNTPRPQSLNYWVGGVPSVTTWYPTSPGAGFRISVETNDAWAAINPEDPFSIRLLGGNNNQSNLQPHVIGLSITSAMLRDMGLPTTTTVVDKSGWVDVNGFVLDECSETTATCIPYSYESVPVLQYQYRGERREYDVHFGRQSAGWLKYPGAPAPFVVSSGEVPSPTPTPITPPSPTPTPIPSPSPTPVPPPTPTPIPTPVPPTPTPITPQPSGGFIVDHTNLGLFDEIPLEYIQEAAQLTMAFADRSVGSNINDGLTCLSYPDAASAPVHCRRPSAEVAGFEPSEIYDRQNWEFLLAGTAAEYYNLDLGGNQVVGYMPNYLEFADGRLLSQWDEYIARLKTREVSHQVIYYTSSLARITGTPYSTQFNEKMRTWASENDKVLVDIADILSHRPDGSECLLNGYPIICETYTSERNGGHLGTPSAGKIRVAEAIWVAMAKIAGWNP